MNKSDNKGLLSVHLAVFLFGVVGLFAKLVNLPAVIIVLGRVFFSSLFLWIFLFIRKQRIWLYERNEYLWMAAAGVILAVHWSSFMQAIQSSTVAVGTLTFSTFPLFVTFMEPYLFHEKLKVRDVICACIMLVGVFLIVPEFSLENTMTRGVLWGLLSAVTYAALSLLNRRFTEKYQAAVVSFYEQGVATVVLLPTLFLLKPEVTIRDLSVLMVLGVVFTALAHSLFINGLRTVRVQTAGIISGLESVYGIACALIFLGEVPGMREIAGGILILAVVFYSTKEAAE
ncbi:MAG: DMT family transporter [Bariatricus sp.]|nr:DMT family transporter [Bariatricus sp.]